MERTEAGHETRTPPLSIPNGLASSTTERGLIRTNNTDVIIMQEKETNSSVGIFSPTLTLSPSRSRNSAPHDTENLSLNVKPVVKTDASTNDDHGAMIENTSGARFEPSDDDDDDDDDGVLTGASCEGESENHHALAIPPTKSLQVEAQDTLAQECENTSGLSKRSTEDVSLNRSETTMCWSSPRKPLDVESRAMIQNNSRPGDSPQDTAIDEHEDGAVANERSSSQSIKKEEARLEPVIAGVSSPRRYDFIQIEDLDESNKLNHLSREHEELWPGFAHYSDAQIQESLQR